MTLTVEAVADTRVVEALRNGVPNAAAVRALGSSQPKVERLFTEALNGAIDAMDREQQVPGIMLSGGFGAGKSHLLEYLEQVALSRNFVASRVVISKETPLHDPAKVFRAAVDSARVPGRSGMALHEIALGLRQNSPAYARLYLWANHEESGIAPLFPATLLLHERLKNDLELVERILNFWSGDPLPIKIVREGLREIRELAAFPIKAVRARDLTRQRWMFANRIIQGAGYAGWVLLIDEVELIGRYSLLQRAKSYAEVARWMGRVEGQGLPGLITVAAITDDFAAAILDEREDRDKVGPRLRHRGTEEYLMLEGRAEAGMRLIDRECVRLEPPTPESLNVTYQTLREIHGRAYAWRPPDIKRPEVTVSRPMRSYIRHWVNEWDLLRLYPGARVSLQEEEIHMTYREDTSLEEEIPGGAPPPAGEE